MSANSPSPPTNIFEHIPTAIRRLIVLDLACGILLVSPFFRPSMATPGFGLLALVLFLPYLVVCWRLLRHPEAKEGPALAAGMGFLFTLLAALGCAVVMEQRDRSAFFYVIPLGVLHGLLAGMSFSAFRAGTSTKPVWRIVLRSLVDPLVYYGIVFFITMGALGYH